MRPVALLCLAAAQLLSAVLWSAECMPFSNTETGPPMDPLAFRGQPGAAAQAAPPPIVDDGGDPPVTRRAWEQVRRRLRLEWRRILGAFPRALDLKTEVLETERMPDHERLRVRYRVDERRHAEAYLLRPLGVRGRLPAVVVLHATSETNMADPVGLSGREAMHMALHLVRRGFVCLAPRNYLWSEPGVGYAEAARRTTDGMPYTTGMARMTWEAMRAVDLLSSRPDVDAARIGAIGHSLGGKETLYLAAFDPRVRATVSCEGGIGRRFSNWNAPWYLGSQIDAEGFRADHHELLALVAPRAFLLIGGDSADGSASRPFLARALPAWEALGKPDALAFQLHQYGHDFPPPGPQREAVYAWLTRHLESSR